MKNETRLLGAEDFDDLVSIFVDAYPGFGIDSDGDRERFRERIFDMHTEDPTASFHGLFRGGALLGIMCLYDFEMNFLQSRVAVAGVGQVAVSLTHKREHVAKEMMEYFLHYCREHDRPFAALYPFRPDFYRSMGFGYGTKMNQYRIRPSALPLGPSKGHVRYLTGVDRQALIACYQRLMERTHGMFAKTQREAMRLFSNPQHRIVGYEKDGLLQGYLVFTWEQGDNFIVNDIHVKEFMVENREALLELVTFLNTQADQVRFVIINTQDEYFHHLLTDPRNDSGTLIPDVYHETNTQGVGLMYRVIDVAGLLEALQGHDFGGQTCRLRLTIDDSFLPENEGSTLLRFERGRVQRLDTGPHDVEIGLDIADYASLLTGTVDFSSLYRYSLARISDPAFVPVIDRLFHVSEKPICVTPF